MNNYFSIANNILTGSLRPWSKENKDEEKFRHLLNHGLRQQKDHPAIFCKELITTIKDLKVNTESDNIGELEFLSQVNNVIPLTLELPSFYNKQTEFYTYLIQNTFQCSLSTIDESLQDAELVDTTYQLYQIFIKIEELVSISKDVKVNDLASSQIVDLLKFHLYTCHSILREKFSDSINFEILSESENLFQLCPMYETEKGNKIKLAYYIDKYKADIESVQEIKIDSPVEVITDTLPVTGSFESFRYKQYSNSEKISNLWDSLKNFNFIAQDTNSKTFKKIFSGNKITNPVYWTGNPSEFAYFIKLIYLQHKLVDNLKQQQWEVACKCFVQTDGTPFERSKLRGLKKPQLSYQQLELAVDNLK